MTRTLRKLSKVTKKVTTKRVTAKVVLLSDGNPQSAKAYGDALVEAHIVAVPGWKRDVGRRLDSLIARPSLAYLGS